MSDHPDLRTAAAQPTVWDTEAILPAGFRPMLATTAAGPLDSSEYAYEVKWEGLRVLTGLQGPALIMRTGGGQEPAEWFPELAGLRAAAQPDWVLLDGELVVMEEGRPSLLRLQQRMQAADRDTVSRLAGEAPATLVLYDILRIGDSWLLDVNWDERREILTRAVESSSVIRVAPAAQTGEEALGWARATGLEAVVAKRLRGRYYPGERTRDWLSIRPREVVETVVCGWTEGRGARAGTIGTLLLGVYRGSELVYIGHTGTGLDAETLRTLHADLVRRAQRACPFPAVPPVTAEPHWVRPELVCRVRHQGWSDGGKMRSPTFLEMVTERRPTECRLPAAAPATVASGRK